MQLASLSEMADAVWAFLTLTVFIPFWWLALAYGALYALIVILCHLRIWIRRGTVPYADRIVHTTVFFMALMHMFGFIGTCLWMYEYPRGATWPYYCAYLAFLVIDAAILASLWGRLGAAPSPATTPARKA